MQRAVHGCSSDSRFELWLQAVIVSCISCSTQMHSTKTIIPKRSYSKVLVQNQMIRRSKGDLDSSWDENSIPSFRNWEYSLGHLHSSVCLPPSHDPLCRSRTLERAVLYQENQHDQTEKKTFKGNGMGPLTRCITQPWTTKQPPSSRSIIILTITNQPFSKLARYVQIYLSASRSQLSTSSACLLEPSCKILPRHQSSNFPRQ